MEVKGSVLLSCLAFVKERYSEDKLENTLQALEASSKPVFELKVLPANWYPFDALIDFMHTARNQVGSTDIHFYRDMGRFAVDYGVNRFYRFLMALASTERVLKRTSAIWPTFYKPGRMVVLKNEKNAATLRLESFPHSSEAFCDRIMGWMQRLVELTGGWNCQVTHPQCVTRGDTDCIYSGTWMLR